MGSFMWLQPWDEQRVESKPSRQGEGGHLQEDDMMGEDGAEQAVGAPLVVRGGEDLLPFEEMLSLEPGCGKYLSIISLFCFSSRILTRVHST